MFRKTLMVLCCAAMIVLASGAAPAFAKESPPTFTKAFSPPITQPYYTGLLSIREFKSYLYIPVFDDILGGQIWRSKDGNSWASVTDHGFEIDPRYKESWDMTVFKGKLYVSANCLFDSSPTCPGMILRTSNGKDWEHFSLATGSSWLDKLGVFGDMIYATSVSGGGQIWRSRTGDPGTWQAVKNLDPGVGSSSSPTEYKGQVYITGSDSGPGVFIWHSADGIRWDTTTLKISDSTGGYYRDGRLRVFQGALYLCVINAVDGGAIYRTRDGKNWDKVLFGLPPVAGMTVIGVADMIAYNGDLYATAGYYSADFSTGGTQLWRSHSGNPGSWELVNPDPAIWGAGITSERGTMEVFKGSLYIEDIYLSLYRMQTH